MKTCTDCNGVKLLSDFYARQSKCKPCIRARVRAYRAANIDRVREYDRNRPNMAERMALNRENYRKRTSTPTGKHKEFSRTADWMARNAEKRRAHILLGNAIRSKKIVPKPCERCGFALGIQGHHEDYSKPLDVMWLCKKCHGQRHREINAERRKAA